MPTPICRLTATQNTMLLLRPCGLRSITRKLYTFYQQRKLEHFGWISDQTAIISLYSVYRLVKCESTFPSNAPTFFFFFLWKVPKASFVCPSGVRNVYMKMSVDHWWSDIDRVKPKSEKTLSQCHFFPPEISRGSAWDGTRASAVETSIKNCSPRGRNWFQ